MDCTPPRYPRKVEFNTRRIAPARTLHEPPSRRTEFPAAGSKIQKAMADEVLKSFGGNEVIRSLVYELIQVAIELQRALDTEDRIHCFLSCGNSETPKPNKDNQLFPIVSTLSHCALITNNLGSKIAAQAICDAFWIA